MAQHLLSMNRILLVSGLALGFAVGANAQSNQSTTTQSGNNNNAGVTQTGTLNQSDLTQLGASAATVNQNGSGNRVDGLTPATSFTQTSSQLNATQTGSNNRLFGTQNASSATVSQTSTTGGSGNLVNLTQTGAGDFGGPPAEAGAEISQNGNGNIATVRQSSASQTDVTQVGTGNTATVDQYGNPTSSAGSTTTVYQNGMNNDAVVRQQSGASFATIEQFGGNGNDAFIDQRGDNDAGRITQDGNRNQARTTGIPGILQRGDNNTTTIDQVGNDNVARTTTGLTTAGAGEFNTIAITQSGNEQLAAFDTDGGDNDIVIQQSGGVAGTDAPGPTPSGTPNLGYSNVANGRAVGDNNEIRIVQTGTRNAVATSNQVQSGRGVDIVGDDNLVSVEQTGTGFGNRAVFDVDGDLNQARLTQEGSSTADVVQNGDSNRLQGLSGSGTFATQDGASTLFLDQIGTSNTLSLSQDNGATATALQDGTGNQASVSQN